MSEKRQRKQQRRQRRKAQGARPADGVYAEVARLATKSVAQATDALDAELWASDLMGALSQGDEDHVLFRGFVHALQRLGTERALAALRALGSLEAPGAGAAADRLAATGVSEPAWAAGLGGWQPVAAMLLEEPVFDDGVSVLVEFADASGERHTISAYIDHNLGGIVKDAFVADGLAEVRERMDTAPDHERLTLRELGLAEARARLEAALYELDHTLGPPVGDDVHALRALIEARLRLLPDAFELPSAYVEVSQQERDALLADFLASREGRRWKGDEDGEFAAQLAIDFGADYNHGGPLRWSSVVVEIFMLDWLARKVSVEPEFFELVPAVLGSWVAYAGRRRGVPDHALREAILAVAEYDDEMLETVRERFIGPYNVTS